MRKASIEPYARRLIWQEISPAPFESGWSIFSKLIGLNALSPKEVAQLISRADSEKSWKTNLNYKESAWIDFDRFGQLLNIDPDRLRSGFLDNWGQIKTDYTTSKGEKICDKCLSRGYHNVFFELGFINICPWHGEKLIPCRYCLTTINKRGLREEEDPKNPEWSIRSSECKHITVNDKSINCTNVLNNNELTEFENSSVQFCDWWNKLRTQPEVFQFLAKTDYSPSEEKFLGIFLNAAQELAGICPWPLDYPISPVRTLTWHKKNQSCEDYDVLDKSASRSSVWGQNYRSIRKHLYRKYIKPHKVCWNLLTHSHPFNLYYLNSSTACYACLAFATWRLLNENLLGIDDLKDPSISTSSIKLFELPEKNFVQSHRAYTNLLYAQFFSLWQLIIIKSSIWRVAINAGNRNIKDYIPFITYDDMCTVLIQSPDYLFNNSMEHCANRGKNCGSMFHLVYGDYWFENLQYQRATDGQIFFKIFKHIATGHFQYLNL